MTRFGPTRTWPSFLDRATWNASRDLPQLLVPCVDIGGTRISMFTTLTSFGTPMDITLDELAVGCSSRPTTPRRPSSATPS
ncbi:MAG: hypothetical protein R2705_24200 [Ilumatobacteraceae bacterium]